MDTKKESDISIEYFKSKAILRWDNEADAYNQWNSLDSDEQLILIWNEINIDYVMVPRDPTTNTIQDMHYAEISYKARGLPEAGLARVLYDTIIESTSQPSE